MVYRDNTRLCCNSWRDRDCLPRIRLPSNNFCRNNQSVKHLRQAITFAEEMRMHRQILPSCVFIRGLLARCFFRPTHNVWRSIQRNLHRQKEQGALLQPIFIGHIINVCTVFQKQPCNFFVTSCAKRYLQRRHSTCVERPFWCYCVYSGRVFGDDIFYCFKIIISYRFKYFYMAWSRCTHSLMPMGRRT